MKRSHSLRLCCSVLTVCAGLVFGTPEIVRGAGAPFYGFTPFPYDYTAEAIMRTHELIVENATLYALHFDDCVPWQEILADQPLPEKVQKDWDDLAQRIPRTHKVYVALTPGDKDRRGLAPPCGAGSDEPGTMPRELQGASLDHPRVKQAFLAYARRAVQQFKPHFLNIGIEMGNMALRYPKDWPHFVALYEHVYTALKQEFPTLPIGFSINPQMLREPRTASRVKPLVERSDYLGLSFYPYSEPMERKLGAPAMPAGPAGWQEMLAWVRTYTAKPIALCETGFTTQDVTLEQYDLHLRGDPAMQETYVRDLVHITKRDAYLFVVWFLVVDYDNLYAKMPTGSEVNLLWRNIGLFDGELRPKPAWRAWQAFADGASPTVSPVVGSPPVRSTAAAPPLVSGARQGVHIGFQRAEDLFACAPGSQVALDSTGPRAGLAAMRWEYQQKPDWQWCAKDREVGEFSQAATVHFWVRSDVEGPIYVRFDEQSGESFYAIVNVGSEWQSVSLALADLSLDTATRKDGQLDPAHLTKLLLADSSGLDGATGKRTIWLSEWLFE
jgi:hypothetical protein